MIEQKRLPAVVLSGGSEIITASLLEEFHAQKIPVVLIKLGVPSLLRDALPVIAYKEITWPPTSIETASKELKEILTSLGAGTPQPWPAFPTEDGGLRLLVEKKELLGSQIAFGQAEHLHMGGLDKAELFENLYDAGLGDICAPTRIATEMKQIPSLVEELGGDCIIKPSLKPLSMQLDGMPSKIINWEISHDNIKNMEALAATWHISKQWIVQQKLITPVMGEIDWYGVCNKNQTILTSSIAFEKWKQPKSGGSGCWVFLDPSYKDDLTEMAKKIIKAIGLYGIAEFSFLKDKTNKWRLLELNPRPWLQIGLPWRAGIPMATAAYHVLSNQPFQSTSSNSLTSWVNPERTLLAAVSGDYGNRWQAMQKAIRAIHTSDMKVMYDSPFPALKRRWVGRMAQKAWKQIVGRVNRKT